MPFVGDALRFPFFAFAADGTPATGLNLEDFTVVVDDPAGDAISGVTVTAELGNGQYIASKAETAFEDVGEYLCVVTYGGATPLAQTTIPIFATSADGTWITTVNNIWAFLQTLLASIVAALQPGGITLLNDYDAEKQILSVRYGEDRTATSPRGRVEITHAVSGLDLTDATALSLSVRMKDKAKFASTLTPMFTLEGDALDANTAAFDLIAPNTTKLPGNYIFDLHAVIDGENIYPVTGTYIVQETVTPPV